ncbi:Nucleoporin NUP82 [Wickerhamiella sorbophila]|uniref:Nucleoporin NUP82 n=1 Tax=Wickerhamiella sorbophila TaxID=45607 RepID=A0A2T0FG15_9ASCO|nr:Nucleoporin NUP82 [Wickerhamiella sorbophila]PRT53925.1 Nucleoporin NUP82 [Wickerhamiella sorbophila]
MLGLSALAKSTGDRPIKSVCRGRLVFTAFERKIFQGGVDCKEFCSLPADIDHLVLNSSATLLAAGCEDRVHIFNVKTGAVEATCKFRSAPIDLAWHPLGVNDACIVALIPGAVVTYNLSSKGSVSETLHLARDHTGTFDATTTAGDAVSLAFGKDNTTGPMTLFLATSDGDIYGVCPFLPAEFKLSRHQIANLLNYALATDFHLRSAPLSLDGVDQIRAEQNVAKRQLNWVQEIMKEASEFTKEEDVVLLRPSRPVVAIQGPLSIAPFPDVLYDDEVLDLAIGQIENAMVFVQLMKTHVNFYLMDTPLNLSWSSSVAEPHPLALIESITTPATENGKLHLHGQMVFVQIDTSTIVLQTSGWQDTLSSAIQSGADLPASLPQTTQQVLPKSLIVEHQTYMLTRPLSEAASQKWFYRSGIEPSDIIKALPNPEPVAYPSLLDSKVMESVNDFMSKLSLDNTVPGPISLSNDEESLAKLNDLTTKFERDMARLYKAISIAVNHVHVLRSELYRQLTKVHSLDSSLQKLDRRPVLEKLEKCKTRQSGIASRIQALHERVLNATQSSLPLSDQERRFRAEAERVNGLLNNKKPTLASRVSDLGPEFGRVTTSSPPANPSSWAEIQGLKTRLAGIQTSLTKLTSELQSVKGSANIIIS